MPCSSKNKIEEAGVSSFLKKYLGKLELVFLNKLYLEKTNIGICK